MRAHFAIILHRKVGARALRHNTVKLTNDTMTITTAFTPERLSRKGMNNTHMSVHKLIKKIKLNPKAKLK